MYRYYRSVIASISLLIGAATMAQDHPFYVYGESWDLDTKQILINYSITATDQDDTTNVLRGRVDGKGRYDLELPFDRTYKVEFQAPGYVTKHVLIDLNGVAADKRNGDLGMNIQVALFRPIENIDYSLIGSQPYGICRINKKGRSIEWDEEYTKSHAVAFQAVMDKHMELRKGMAP